MVDHRQRPSPSSTYSVATVRYPHVVPMPLLLLRQEQSYQTKSYSLSSKWLKLPRWLVSFQECVPSAPWKKDGPIRWISQLGYWNLEGV